MERLTIAQVGPGLLPIPPTAYGAIERHIFYLSRELERLGNAVTIINEPLGSEYRWAPKASRIIKKGDFSIIHVHSDFCSAFLSVSHPIIYTSHTPVWSIDRHTLRDRWGYFCSKFAVTHAQRTIALTPAIAQRMGAACKTADTAVVPNGVDTDEYRPNYKGRTGNKICMLGKVVPHKNFHLIAEATKGMDCELHIIGVQPDEAYVKTLRNINPECIFHKDVSNAELIGLLSTSDIFVHPSSAEALSIAVLEAMACGLPIIGSPLCNDQIADGVNGFVVDAASPGAYRDRIQSLLQDRALAHTMAEKSRAAALENYSWKNVAGRILNIYKIEST